MWVQSFVDIQVFQKVKLAKRYQDIMPRTLKGAQKANLIKNVVENLRFSPFLIESL